jgi:hypothetical protein
MAANPRFVAVAGGLLVGLAVGGLATDSVLAEEACIAAPSGAAPEGSHWYYRTDTIKQTKCWHLAPKAEAPQGTAAPARVGIGPTATLPPIRSNAQPARTDQDKRSSAPEGAPSVAHTAQKSTITRIHANVDVPLPKPAPHRAAPLIKPAQPAGSTLAASLRTTKGTEAAPVHESAQGSRASDSAPPGPQPAWTGATGSVAWPEPPRVIWPDVSGSSANDDQFAPSAAHNDAAERPDVSLSLAGYVSNPHPDVKQGFESHAEAQQRIGLPGEPSPSKSFAKSPSSIEPAQSSGGPPQQAGVEKNTRDQPLDAGEGKAALGRLLDLGRAVTNLRIVEFISASYDKTILAIFWSVLVGLLLAAVSVYRTTRRINKIVTRTA